LKVTLKWLKEFVDFSLTPDELAHALTMAGLEVEEFYTEQRNFSQIIVGKILSVEKHPNADKLSVCMVDAGDKQFNVVCGAPNVFQGMLAPLALDGATVANGLKITSRQVRGVKSNGMLCSEADLDLSERSAGLMVLPDNAPVGKKMEDYLGDTDIIFDIFITPNRPDCLSVFGIAREIAAITGSTLKKPVVTFTTSQQENISNYIRVEIENINKCSRYSGRLIKNVKIKPSPFWLAARLHAVGIRSINNVVDITNYVMMETGQPLHAFDYDKIAGKVIIVREAVAGENFVILDEQEHILDKEALLICDAEKPVALAGIMGGLNSEVDKTTSTIFLESAYFDSGNVRKTGKNLDIFTESSRRFERGTDPNGTVYAMDRAAKMMEALAEGQVFSSIIDNYPRTINPVEIDLSVKSINTLLGKNLSADTVTGYFPALEIEITKQVDDFIQLKAPTFRPDLTREVDIIEEIARLYGYNNIASEIAPRINQSQEPNQKTIFNDQIRHYLVGFGFKETVAYSLVSEQLAEPFLPSKCEFAELLNPISTDMAGFRPSIILSLLTSVAYNRNRQISNLRLFEIGNVAWKETGKEGFTEITQIGGVVAGKNREQSWYGKEETFDFYDVKGTVTALLLKCGIDKYEQGTVVEPIWENESSSILIDGKYYGAFGKINRDICSLFKIKVADVFGFFINFQELFQNRAIDKKYDPVSKFPSVSFDLAMLIDANIALNEIEKEIRSSAGPYLTKVRLFDFYKGEQVKEGKKSVAFSLTFSSKECTLEDEEVEQAVNNVLLHLNKLFDAVLRPG